jgi:hypothetical protein
MKLNAFGHGQVHWTDNAVTNALVNGTARVTNVAGGNETRPINANVNFIIKI